MAARKILHLAATVSSLLILLALAAAVKRSSARELRCDAICNFEDLREQCERCRLRHPMRFGKRSSPPEDEGGNEEDGVDQVPLRREMTALIDLDQGDGEDQSRSTRGLMQILAEALLWARLEGASESSNKLEALLLKVDERQRTPSSSVVAVRPRRRKRSLAGAHAAQRRYERKGAWHRGRFVESSSSPSATSMSAHSADRNQSH